MTSKENKYQKLLKLAASNGHEDILEMLVNIGYVVDRESLIEPLIEASRNGFVGCASLILNQNVSPNSSIKHRVGGQLYPLHVASYFGHVDVVNILMAHGGDAISRNKKHGRNALANAILNLQK